jgi:hypothetical protein
VDRRLLHKTALVAGALVVIGGAVLVLRDPGSGDPKGPPPPPPAQTVVHPYTDKSVLVPHPGERPKPPQRLDIQASDHRLVIGWGPGRIGAPEPDGAVGYEVRWGRSSRLVATPVIQLDGLDNDVPYRIEVRTVDMFGQRSAPAVGQGTPVVGQPDSTQYSLLDRFDGAVVPDPARWRLVGTGNCTKASKGDGEDRRRLVITGQCGASDEGIALRSRTPLRLNAVPSGELGRVTVRTDRPGQDGELIIDLVPGPVDLIGRAPSGVLGQVRPGLTTVDDGLPPGTIRVRISAWPHGIAEPGDPTTVVQVQVPPGTPTLGTPIAVAPLPQPDLNVSVRWDVILRTDGVFVQRDGVVVGGGDVLPTFTEATPLLEFTGQGGIRASIDMIGLGGAPSPTPPLLPAPRIDFEREVAWPGSPPQTTAASDHLPGVHSGQLRITLVPQANLGPDSQFIVDIGGQQILARRAIPTQPALAAVRLPIVADIPAEALTIRPQSGAINVVVHATHEQNGLATQVLTAELELTGDPPPQPSRTPDAPLARPNPTLAVPTAALHDAAGTPIPTMQEVPRGRLVLDVILDPVATQRFSGAVAGLAGIEISIDGKPLAGIPTVTDGPGIGGHYRLAVDTNDLPSGGHNIQVIAIGTEATTSFAITYAPFVLR